MSIFYPITVWPFVSAFLFLWFCFSNGLQISWIMVSLDHCGSSQGVDFNSTYWPRQGNPQSTNWVLPVPLTDPVLCLCFARTWTLHSLPVSFLTLVWTLLLYNSVRTLLFPGDSGSGLGNLLCPYWWAPFSMLYIGATSPWPLHIGHWMSQRLHPDSIFEEGRVVLFP